MVEHCFRRYSRNIFTFCILKREGDRIKSFEKFLNSKSKKLEVIDKIVIENEEYKNVIDTIVKSQNLILQEKTSNVYEYKYTGKNYRRVLGTLERIKILMNEIYRVEEYSYFQFLCGFEIDEELIIKVYEYSPSNNTVLENRYKEIMKRFLNNIVDLI